MEKKRLKRVGNSGFTMVELLIVIAIIAALAAVGIFSAGLMRDRTKQAQLDRLAENLYSAAQNQLTLRAERYGADDEELLTKAVQIGDTSLYYTSGAYCLLAKDAAECVLPSNSISADLSASGWLVEFNPESHSVDAVYVVQTDKKSDLSDAVSVFESAYGDGTEVATALTESAESRRLAYKSTVGYYKGSSAAAVVSKATGDLGCKVEIENREELIAKISVQLPTDESLRGTTLNLRLNVTVTGEQSGRSHELDPIDLAAVTVNDLLAGQFLDPTSIVLDSLKKDDKGRSQDFIAQFCSDPDANKNLMPGENITVTAEVECTNASLKDTVQPAVGAASTNSMFADGSKPLDTEDKAVVLIEYGRHLQNLNYTKSTDGGVNAQLKASLDFASTEGDNKGWKAVYPSLSFVPISNDKLISFTGADKGAGTINYYSISNLTINGQGLFKSFKGSSLNSVKLVNAEIIGGDAPTGALVGEAVPSDKLDLKVCSLEKCTVVGNGTVGGMVGTVTGKLALSGCTFMPGGETDKELYAVTGGGAAGGLAGTVSDELTVKGCVMHQAMVTGGGAAGGVVGIADKAASFTDCESVDVVVLGKTAAGGLLGSDSSTADKVSVASCAFYMDILGANSTTSTTADKVDWMKADNSASAAGGLIGKTNCAVEINKSFAATVVEAKSWAGGLVGRVQSKALKVTESYADCYISASTMIGGLAGECGAGSSFEKCYSAGFVLNEGITSSTRAAGFVPSAANVKNSYTIFCYDDPIKEPFDTYVDAHGNTIKAPTLIAALKEENKFAFTTGGTPTNAYYVYGKGAKTVNSAQEHQITGTELKDTTIPGFTKGQSEANKYKLTKVTMGAFYVYPTNGLDHYNDFYADDDSGKDIAVYTVAMLGQDTVSLEFNNKPESAKLSSKRIDVPYDVYSFNHKQQGRVFVGWLYVGGKMNETNALTKLGVSESGLVELCKQIDALTIDKTNALFSYSDASGKLNAAFSDAVYVLNYDTVLSDGKINRMSIKADSIEESLKDADDPVIYALYREVMNSVKVEYRSFDDDVFVTKSGSNVTIDTTVTTAKYREAGFTVMEEDYRFNPLLEENTFNVQGIPTDLKDSGYSVVDSDYLQSKYPTITGHTGFVTAAGFAKDGTIITDNGSGGSIYTKEDGKGKLTYKINKDITYVVLCDGELITVPVKFEFRDAVTDTTNNTETSPMALSALEDYVTQHVSYQEGATLTLYVNMKLQINEVLWKGLPEFEGMNLLDEEIENAYIDKANYNSETLTYDKDKYPVVPYEWITYTLAFDLEQGVHCTYLDSEMTKVASSAAIPSKSMHIRESISDVMPVSEAAKKTENALDRGYVFRPDYYIDKWEFYDLESYDPENPETLKKTITIYTSTDTAPDGKTLNDVLGTLKEEYNMSTHGIMARAHWTRDTKAAVRVEIYIQDVTNAHSLADANKTYLFYKSFQTENKVNVSDYAKLDYIELSRTVFSGMSADGKKTLRDGLDMESDREYLLSPIQDEKTIKETTSTTTPAYYSFDYVGTGWSIFGGTYYKGDYSEYDTQQPNSIEYNGKYYVYVGTRKGLYERNYHPEETNYTTNEVPNVDGTIKNKQFLFNYYWSNNQTAYTTGSNKTVSYKTDDTGTAVFKIYYDRQVDTFTFKLGKTAEVYTRAKKQHYPDASLNNYSLYEVKWDNDRGCYTFYHNYHDRDLWIVNDQWIDAYANRSRRYDSDGGDDTLATSKLSAIITIDGRDYVYGRILDYNRVYYKDFYHADYWDWEFYGVIVPYYDAADVTAAVGYSWMNTRNYKGLYKKEGGNNKNITIMGLYEQPLKVADPGFEWPENGRKFWTVKTADNTLVNSSMPFVDSFYYSYWIRNKNTYSSTELVFTPNNGSFDSDYWIRFYVEKLDARNAGETPVESHFNSGEDYSFIQYDERTYGYYIYTLNNKFDGFSVYAYNTDFNNNGFTTRDVRTGKQVNYYKHLSIYFARNTYQVIYNNVNQNTCKPKDYLYEQNVTYLPDIREDNEDDYRPTGSAAVTREHHFAGWYTASGGPGGGGREVVLKDLDGVQTVCYADDNSPVQVPAGNLTLFAYWTIDDVKLNVYSRIPETTSEAPLLVSGETDYPTLPDAKMYKQIPANTFNTIYTRWKTAAQSGKLAGTFNNAMDTYSVVHNEGGKTYTNVYTFDGWYTTAVGTPSYDANAPRLRTRFYESEYVSTPLELQLVGQWTQTSGMGWYNVKCVLYNDANEIESTFVLSKLRMAEVGKPLTVSPPTKDDDERLNGYYPLNSVASLDGNFVPGVNDTLEFRFKRSEPWSYKIYGVTTLNAQNGTSTIAITFYEKEKEAFKDNDYAYIDVLDGYMLYPADQKVKDVMKSDPKDVTYSYKLKDGAISLVDGGVTWSRATDAAKAKSPLVYNTYSGKLENLTPGDENRRVVERFSVDNGGTWFTGYENLLTVNGTGKLAAKGYTVKISLEVYEGNTSVLTFFTGSTHLEVTE